MKPEMFIGSSSEAGDLARNLEALIQHEVACTVWPNAFQMSRGNMDNLMSTFRKMDFGAFIWAPDDATTMRAEVIAMARDNVVLEMGLFAGDRDLERTFMVRPHDVSNLRTPSDLAGITAATFSWDRAKDDPRNALSPAATEILRAIKQVAAKEPRLDFRIFAREEPTAHWKLKLYVQVINNTGQSVVLRSVGMNLNLPLELDYPRTQGRILPGFVIDKRDDRDIFDSTVLLRHGETKQIWLPLLPNQAVHDVKALIDQHTLGVWRYEECWLDVGHRVRLRALSI